jgi:hypothetical protein
MAMRGPFIVALGILAGAFSNGDRDQSIEPLQMTIKEEAGTVVIQLVGNAVEPVQLTYDLAFTGASQSRNRGIARLVPGSAKVVTTLRMNISGPWSAKLSVTGDRNYAQTASGG